MEVPQHHSLSHGIENKRDESYITPRGVKGKKFADSITFNRYKQQEINGNYGNNPLSETMMKTPPPSRKTLIAEHYDDRLNM